MRTGRRLPDRQETLTDTLKHAGKDAKADVLLRHAEDAPRIQVTDDGSGGGRPPRGRPATAGPERGPAGIRERAAAFRGTARATPLVPYGFQPRVPPPWT
ncbi:hypothetical protein ACQP1K_19945 [Sphaerimonospora sp. CA-214678]|uniref:hypothetical protein n=1 Tax=Sphaerimonospora sp. CA-214678 TaxID=3240029 RepID=UPI003D8AE167